jgi:hypothetical protein
VITDDIFPYGKEVKDATDKLDIAYDIKKLQIDVRQLNERLELVESRTTFLFVGLVICLISIFGLCVIV